MSLIPILHTSRPRLYGLIVVVAAFGALAFSIRVSIIFSCPAEGYGSDRFLEYCQADGYGDYDHGALLFGLEPEAEQSARDAEVVFLGNSREQFAFSTAAV